MLKKFMTSGTLMALAVISLSASLVNAQILFSDDFENPASSGNKWEVITGDWEVADGVYHQLSTADRSVASINDCTG